MKKRNKIKDPQILKQLKIRKATAEDIALILDIQRKDDFAHAYYLTHKRLGGLFKAGEIFFIAFLGNETVGFVSLYIEIRARLHFLSVKKKHTKKGIGSFLIQKAINEVKKRKKKMIFVYTEADSPIEDFFVKRGFKKVGYFNDRFGKGKHASIFGFYL